MTLRPADGPVRGTVKALARAVFSTHLRIRRAWNRRQRGDRWVLGGDCRLCAACCERPSIQVDRLTWHLRTFRGPFLWWQRVVNGFVLVARERPRVFVFQCLYFDTATRRCTSYETRPGICRDYPRLLLEAPWPELLSGCGYRPVAHNADRMLVALGNTSLTEEQKARLKERLRAE
jgi:hypothetical protein